MTINEARQRARVPAASVWDNPALPPLLREVHLADESGKLRQSKVATNGLGAGPHIDPQVVERFAQLDTTPNLSTLRWMLLQAGGGEAAMRQSEEKFQMCKTLFIQERMAGKGEAGTEITPMRQEEAEAAWAAEEHVFRNAFFPGDDDMLIQNSGEVFGFARHWPGYENVYEEVFNAVRDFFDNTTGRIGSQTKLSIINQARRQRAEENGTQFEAVNVDLKAYKTLAELQEVNEEFKYFFKRRTASKDIQFVGRHPEKPEYTRGSDVKFYDDANLVAFVPATAAAMMKVGFDNWCVANKSEFERAFARRGQRQTPHWTSYTGRGPFMVLIPKMPVEEPQYPAGHQHHQSMAKIAVYMPKDLCDIPNLVPPYEGVQFFDRMNRNHPQPVDYTELQQRLADTSVGEQLIPSVSNAMAAFVDWVRQMQDDEIKSSVYEAMAALLVYDLLNS